MSRTIESHDTDAFVDEFRISGIGESDGWSVGEIG